MAHLVSMSISPIFSMLPSPLRAFWLPFFFWMLWISGCDSGPALDPESRVDPELKQPGTLEAILEADSTLGPPYYTATLRSICTTNGGAATIDEVKRSGPFPESSGYLLRETGLHEVADTTLLVIDRPGRVLLSCISSSGDEASAQLDFDGFAPQMNLDPLHATLTRVEEETIIDLTDRIRWADNVGVVLPQPAYELDVEIDRNEDRTWLRVRPARENGTVTLEVYAENAFGRVRDNLLLNVTYPPGLVLRAVDWMTDGALPSRVAALDENGRVLAVDTLISGNGFIDFHVFDATMVAIRVESDGYFTRTMQFTPDHTDRRVDLTVPVLSRTYCRDAFSDVPDPVSTCLDVTRQLLFKPLDPFSTLDGYRMWPWPPSGGMLYSHAASGATLPAAWAVAARESASQWRDLGITMVSASRFMAGVTEATALRDENGRWTTNVEMLQLFVPDNHDGAELTAHFREGPDGLHSAVISLPVRESADDLFSRLEAIRLRAQLAVGTSPLFESWGADRQNRFLSEWIVPIRSRDRSPYQLDNLERGGFRVGVPFEQAFEEGL